MALSLMTSIIESNEFYLVWADLSNAIFEGLTSIVCALTVRLLFKISYSSSVDIKDSSYDR
jgi:hypothetical protein